MLKDEDFQRVDLEATEPQKGGDKAYALLRDALKVVRDDGP